MRADVSVNRATTARRLLRVAPALALAAAAVLPAVARPATGGVVTAPAAALLVQAELDGLPVAARDGLPRLSLVGSGRLTWLGLHVYDARLFAAGPVHETQWHDAPLALEITYARSVSAARIAGTTIDELARLGVGGPAEQARWRAALERMLPDVAAGHRQIGVHRPGAGVRFIADDRVLGDLDDPLFARGFFAIWLDPRSRAPQLREALLGHARPSKPAAAR
jgi:hypothetical protein